MEITPGASINGDYPFTRSTYTSYEENGPIDEKSWRPGCYMVPYGPEEVEYVADAIGQIVLTFIAKFKPGKYPERVFYIREWISPDGKRFGKKKLRITTKQAFRAMWERPYRLEYRMAEERDAA